MSGLLNQIFLSLSPAIVTDAFLAVMLGVFSLALLFRFTGKGRNFVEQGPGFLTSLGILGTFVGIIIGLYEFSLEEIDRSIADLMAGLKTAFITSVIGLALSLLLRVFTKMLHLPSDPVQESATIDDLNENLITLRASLDNFSHSASDELVAGLERVVNEFNQKLQTQFGDNLNGFCAQLAGLQPALRSAASEYQTHAERVEAWSLRSEESLQALASQQVGLAQMFEKIAALPKLYQGLDQLIKQQSQQAEQLGLLLQGQETSMRQLAELMPHLPQNIRELSSGVAAAQENIDKNLVAINDLMRDHAHALAEQFQRLAGTVSNLQALSPEMLRGLVDESAQLYRDAMREQGQLMAGTHKEMSEALTEVIRQELRSADVSIKRQYEQMDRVMAQQIEQVLSAMGESLATISGSFTRDYRQLLEQMRRLKTRETEYAD